MAKVFSSGGFAPERSC